MNLCVILNPAARGHRAAQLKDELPDLARTAALRYTTGPGAARTVARQAALEGFETIVAAGGDGTINEVLNGLADAPDALARVRLGLLPAGTTNVLARELGIPPSIHDAWRVILLGHEMRLDLPCARYEHQGQTRTHYFAQLAGAGLDARAIALLDLEHKRRWGQFAYAIAGCEALSQPGPSIEVQTPEQRFTGELILIGNGQRYGGPFRFFPRARMDDGQLDVVVFHKADWAAASRVLLAWASGRLDSIPGTRCFQAPTFTLTSGTPVGFELDGELIGQLPVTFTVQRQGLRVLVP